LTQPGTRETCNSCNEDLHVCLNCRFYDLFKAYQCQINNIDPVKNKERSNFCEEFQFADRPFTKNDDKTDKETQKARDLWKKMFKEKE
jgi:hypothetical protein